MAPLPTCQLCQGMWGGHPWRQTLLETRDWLVKKSLQLLGRGEGEGNHFKVWLPSQPVRPPLLRSSWHGRALSGRAQTPPAKDQGWGGVGRAVSPLRASAEAPGKSQKPPEALLAGGAWGEGWVIPCLDLWPKGAARLTPPRPAQQPHSWHKRALLCQCATLRAADPLRGNKAGGGAPPPLLPGVACRQEGSYTLPFSCRGWDCSLGGQRPRSLSQFSNEESPCPQAVRLSPDGDVALF